MKITIKILFILMSVLLVMTGCEYDVAQPHWEQEHENPSAVAITAIEPADGAIAGVNTIKIMGENFADDMTRNHVYFDNVEAEIMESSTIEISVRRPNLVSDASVVKVVSYDALVVATHSPYPIASVQATYGNFLENLALATIATDGDNNLYVVETASRNIFKITPDGDKSQVGVAAGNVSDMKISPDGKLLILFNDTEIHQVNPDAAIDTAVVWTEVTKRVKYGDFDENGNFYVASKSSDLIVIKASDMSSSQIGVYARDEIFCVRVFNGYVYVLVELRSGEPELAIWRHAILDADGNLGDQELVLDWLETGVFAESEPTSFTFDKDGNLFVATDYDSPIMIMDTNGQVEPFYKDILPGPAKQIVWGTDTHLYMIWDGDPDKTVLQVDMGIQGAPYYGW
ncbi:IPT/TIG domain-containing protein [bacterium]